MDRLLLNSTTLKISKPGFDVKSASQQNLALDISSRPLILHSTGTISLPPGASGAANNANGPGWPSLGYRPIVICQIIGQTPGDVGSGIATGFTWSFFWTDTNINVSRPAWTGPTPPTFYFRYAVIAMRGYT